MKKTAYFIIFISIICASKKLQKKIWKIVKTPFTFAPVLYNYLSRKAEGHGPVKP